MKPTVTTTVGFFLGGNRRNQYINIHNFPDESFVDGIFFVYL